MSARPANLSTSSETSIDGAAAWLASEKQPPHPIVPNLQRRFNLSATEAVLAIRQAALIRARAI